MKTAGITRPDTSKNDLNRMKSLGYITVYFVANPNCCDKCTNINRDEYEIESLLILDNPLFRISHPNCLCKFEGWKKGETPKSNIPVVPAPTTAPTTLTEKEVPKEKIPWYKRWYNKIIPEFLRKKKSEYYRYTILKRAKQNAKKRIS